MLAGVASLVAGAISMALGEYTSVKTANEQLDLEVAKERRELQRNPRGELAELVKELRVRGVEAELAREVAAQLSRDPETALRLHVVAEMGVTVDDGPSPRTAALSSLVTFAAGAVVPLIPYLLGFSLLWVALLCGGIGLAVAGALSSRFTPRPWWFAGGRQLLFGAVASRGHLPDRPRHRGHRRLSQGTAVPDAWEPGSRTAVAGAAPGPARRRRSARGPRATQGGWGDGPAPSSRAAQVTWRARRSSGAESMNRIRIIPRATPMTQRSSMRPRVVADQVGQREQDGDPGADPAGPAGLAVPAPLLGALVLDRVRSRHGRRPPRGWLVDPLGPRVIGGDPVPVGLLAHGSPRRRSSRALATAAVSMVGCKPPTLSILPAPARGHRTRESASSGRMGRMSARARSPCSARPGRSAGRRSPSPQQNPDRLRITALAAGGGNVAELADQALTLGVRTLAVARATAAQDLQLAFYAAASQRGWSTGEYSLPEILAGPRAAEELAARPADVVLNGITGSIGLGPTLSALAAGRTVALANKESLVAGGDLVTAAAAPGQLVPVDSEHSALAQCLRGGARGEVARLVLTASGGPFRGRSAAELADVTVDAGARPPDVGHGPGRDDQLGHPGEQGAGADRGAPALRRPLRRHRRRRAPAVDRALDGDLLRRRHHRPGQPAGHAAADRAGAGLARPAARRPAGAGLVDRLHLGVRAAGHRGVPRRPARALRRGGRRRGAGDVQRGQRGGCGRLPRGSAAVPGHRGPRRAYPRRRAGPRRPHLRGRRPGRRALGPAARPRRHRRRHALTGFLLTVLGIVAFAIGLLFSIGFHEYGHFRWARKFGMRVPQFFVGFGPTVFSRTRGRPSSASRPSRWAATSASSA